MHPENDHPAISFELVSKIRRVSGHDFSRAEKRSKNLGL
jgi:hypothetical protein